MTQPMFDNPARQLDCGPDDSVPAREILSRLASYVGGELNAQMRAQLLGDGSVEARKARGALYGAVRRLDDLLDLWDDLHSVDEAGTS